MPVGEPMNAGKLQHSFLVCAHEGCVNLYRDGIPIGVVVDGKIVRKDQKDRPSDEVMHQAWEAFRDAAAAIEQEAES